MNMDGLIEIRAPRVDERKALWSCPVTVSGNNCDGVPFSPLKTDFSYGICGACCVSISLVCLPAR